jgi:hypothetical protein
MKFTRLQKILLFVSSKHILIKLSVSVVTGFLIALVAFLFTQQRIPDIEEREILYTKNGTTASSAIQLSRGPFEALSFFADVNFFRKKGQRVPFILFRASSNQVFFGIQFDGRPYVHWGSKKIVPSHNTSRSTAEENKISWGKWNHIGFVYKEGNLAVYVNARIYWKTSIAVKTFTASEIELFPDENRLKAANPILVAQALSLQHIQELHHDSLLYINLFRKIFFLFLFGTFVSIFFMVYLIPGVIVPTRSSIKTLRPLRQNVLFIFLINFVFFVLLGPGHRIALHIKNSFLKYRFWNPSTYFILLITIALAFFLSLALKKMTGLPYKMCFTYLSGVMSILMFTVVLCRLPRFDDIYPIIFNGLFCLFFSLIITGPNILNIHHVVLLRAAPRGGGK